MSKSSVCIYFAVLNYQCQRYVNCYKLMDKWALKAVINFVRTLRIQVRMILVWSGFHYYMVVHYQKRLHPCAV